MSVPTTVEIDNGLAILTLARGDEGNPMGVEFGESLDKSMDVIEADGTVRAILLRSNGANFCFGGDVKQMKQLVDDGKLSVMLVEGFGPGNAAMNRLWTQNVPVVAEVRGWSAGAGAGLASNADIVIGGESTQFYAAFAGIALTNDSGSTWGLTSRMGLAAARRYYLENQRLNAQQALEAGILDYVVPDDELEAFAMKKARQMADGPSIAYAGIKTAFRKMAARTWLESANEEAIGMEPVATSKDAEEGIIAMAEKRKPVYQGK